MVQPNVVFHFVPIPPRVVSKKGFFGAINHIKALLYAIFHKIMVHKNERIKRKKCFGQAVGNHVPLVIFINIVVLLFDTGFYLGLRGT